MENYPTEYETTRKAAKMYYLSLSKVFCPALNEEVSFTSAGFNHIMYKKGGITRDYAFQIPRFKLLPKAFELLSIATIFQEYEKNTRLHHNISSTTSNEIVKTIQYWGIIAIVGDQKIKVVVRKVGNGHAHFWSIIPAWITNQKRDVLYTN